MTARARPFVRLLPAGCALAVLSCFTAVAFAGLNTAGSSAAVGRWNLETAAR